MGQLELYLLFKRRPSKWFTCREMAKTLKVNESSANVCLRRMLKFGFLESKKSNFNKPKKSPYLYKLKKRKVK